MGHGMLAGRPHAADAWSSYARIDGIAQRVCHAPLSSRTAGPGWMHLVVWCLTISHHLALLPYKHPARGQATTTMPTAGHAHVVGP